MKVDLEVVDHTVDMAAKKAAETGERGPAAVAQVVRQELREVFH